jgi:hypothetical protein
VGAEAVGLKIGCGGSKPPIPNTILLRTRIPKIGPNPGAATSVVCTLTMRFFEIGFGDCGDCRTGFAADVDRKPVALSPRLRIWGLHVRAVPGAPLNQELR